MKHGSRYVGWLGLAAIPTALVVASLWGRDALLSIAPACTFKAATGVPCPMCGSTRAIAALADGDLLDALRHNPTVLLVIAATLYASWHLATNRRLRVSPATFAALLAVAWIATMVSHDLLG